MFSPPFELAPYEVPPHRQAGMDGEPFTLEAECFGQKHSFVGRCVNDDGYCNFLFFGLPDEPERGHFVCAGSEENSYQPENLCWSGNERDILATSIENQRWGRYFVLNAAFQPASGRDATYILFLCCTGYAQLISQQPNFARFRWAPPSAREMWDIPPLELLDQVLATRTSSNDVGFAFDYSTKSHSEHLELAFPLQRGTYSQWQRVCESYALAIDLWEEQHENHALEFSIGLGGRTTAHWLGAQNAKYKVPNNKFHKFALWSYRYFAPTRNDELCRHNPYIEEGIIWENSFVQGHLTRPSQHERLEAIFQLRDWLCDKATPAEIELLLSHDYS